MQRSKSVAKRPFYHCTPTAVPYAPAAVSLIYGLYNSLEFCSFVTMKAAKSKEEIERKKKLAYTLFTENGFEQKVIASITGVSEKSISTWKANDKKIGIDWEEDRIELKQGFDKERRRLKKHINTILENVEHRAAPNNIPTPPEGDTLSKLAAAAEKLQTALSLTHKAATGKQFIAFIQQNHGQAKAIEIVDLWHEYLMGTA